MAKKLNKEDVSPTVESDADKAHRVIRTFLSAIPGAVEIFNSLLLPPLERRREKWMVEVTAAVNELIDSRNLSIDELKSNEQFITTLLHASNAAIRNHQSEKITALRNAVINSALPQAPEESLQQMFLNLVDTFTVWHIKILQFLERPGFEKQRSFDRAFPELTRQQIFRDQLFRDLHIRGMINFGDYAIISRMDSKNTQLGHQFLEFISSSVEE